jgi:hypothetical protein
LNVKMLTPLKDAEKTNTNHGVAVFTGECCAADKPQQNAGADAPAFCCGGCCSGR